jgi:1,2-phenylacetyl-CoA epoxidase PaaB subunit
LQHSSSGLATNNPSWKGQTKKNKDKHSAKSAAGRRKTKPKKITHLINEIGRLSAEVVELLKTSQRVQKS